MPQPSQPKQPCVRWRINANGVEWFWGGRWQPATHPKMVENLTANVASITSTYPQSQNAEFEDRLINLLTD